MQTTLAQTIDIGIGESDSELWAAVDLIAERIRSLGELAPGSYAQFAELSSIAEAHGVPTAEQTLA